MKHSPQKINNSQFMKTFNQLSHFSRGIDSMKKIRRFLLLTGLLLITQFSFSQVYYSYQSGDWDQVSTWTHDPGGTTQTASDVPGDADSVVVLSSRTVSLPGDIATLNLNITIRTGGILDMNDYQFTNGLNFLDGQGTLRLATINFPGVVTNLFVEVDGGTTEYNNSADFTLPSVQAEYNNLIINASGFVATQLADLTINGNLTVANGIFRINDNTNTTALTLTVNGNVFVAAAGSIRVGEGATNVVDDPMHWGHDGGTAPYLNYYLRFHTINLYGDFVNNGSVRFTNLSYPVYNLFPPTTSGATAGAASVYFFGASDNSLICNGTTDFYNLIIDKGVDQSFTLNVYSSAYTNFRLFGANSAEYQNASANPDVRKALWIRTGTLALDGLLVIPSLSEADPFNPGDETTNYLIPSNGALQIDGPNVAVFTTADDYQEINAAYGVAAPDNGTIGITSGLYSAVSVYGKIEMNNGYLSAKESSGFVVFDFVSGEFELNGGGVDAKQYRASTGATGLSSYIQTGGLFELRGRFQRTPAAYTNVADLVNAPINIDRVLSGMNPGLGAFNINSVDNVFNMSGGTIRIYDVGDAAGEAAVEINSSSANTNVSGGQFELIPTAGNILGDAPFWEIASTAPLGNLLINRASSTSEIRLRSDLIIYNNLLLQSGDLNADNQNLTVGGNFTIEGGTSYTTGTNTTIFSGEGDQLFTVNLAAPLTLNRLKIVKETEDIVELAGTQTVLNIADSLYVIDGTFNDGGQTVNLSGNVFNSGTHVGTGTLVFAGDNTHYIDGNGAFENIELTRTTVGNDVVFLENNIRVNGSLTFSGAAGVNKLIDLQRFNLALAEDATVAGADANRYVVVDGEIGGGSITKTYSAASTTFTFPLGVTNYTPGTISLSAAPTTFGDITVSIGAFEHPTVTTNGQNLTYFWRVRESGFSGIPAGSVTHSYIYNDADVVGTETNYLPARYDWTTYTWTSGTTASVDDAANIIGDPWLTNTDNIFGDYTVGETGSFGAVTTYYSIGSGLWSDVSNWSTVGHAGPVAGTIPGAGDAVIIGDNDSIYLANPSNTTPDEDVQNCASLQIEVGAALDITYNPSSDFGMVLNHPNGNGNFRIAASYTNTSSFAFPSGDFSDFNVNLGTTELYTVNGIAGTYFFIPNGVFEYGSLILSPLGGSNIIFPNHDLTLYGSLYTRGEDADSWFCPMWIFQTPYPTAPTVPVAKTITILGNMEIQGGALVWIGNGNLAQDFVVHGDVIVSQWAAITGWTGWGGATNQSLSIGGSLINNTNNAIGGGAGTTQSSINLNNGTSVIPLTFFGDSDASITNTAGTPGTYFNTVTIDKGNSQETTLTMDIAGTVSTLTDNWLTLENGTFYYQRAADLTISQGTPFTIPSTSSLTIETNDDVFIANSAVDNNDLYLQGNLTLINGDLFVGPVAAPNNNNDIEYSGSGSSELDIWGGNLVVNGQIRRNISTTTGILNFNMSGGTLTINGNNAVSSRAKLELTESGSDFTMSAGTITLVHGGGGSTYGDLYLRPSTSSVTGGEIVFSSVASGTAEDYLLDANIMLNNLTITGAVGRDATVELLISPLTVNGDFTLTNTNSIFDANATYNIDVTLNGDFANNGTYNAQNNLTTLSGDVQAMTGTSVTTFYDLDINPNTSFTLSEDIVVNNDLDLISGTLACGDYFVTLLGDLNNDATYTDNATGIVLNGTTQQHISGSGTYGQLELDNAQGARLNNDVTLNEDLTLTTGIFDINRYILTLGQASDILGAPFSDAKMITTDGVYSNVGIQKEFTAGATTFDYPIGTAGKYTPASLTVTANATAGFVRINNINSVHPTSIDPGNALGYYWEITSGGVSGFDGNLVFNYLEEDVNGAQENNYVAARLLLPGTSWSESLTVDDAANTATFNFTGTNNLSGGYTAGISGAFPPDIPEFTTFTNGNWADSIWTQTGGSAIPYPVGGPNGFILIINDTVTTDINYATAYQTTINGQLNATGGYYGHNIGNVQGTGTLYLENATIPAGRYTNFLSCGSNGTLEYGGTGTYTIIADLFDTISGLTFSGTGTRVLPAKDLTICNQLIIDGPTLDNSVNNFALNIMGTFERYNTGVFESGTGAGATVRFTGFAPQTIGGITGDFTGSSAFNNIEINNGSRLTLNTGANIDIDGELLLTDGIIYTSSTENLTITNTDENAVIPAGGGSSSYVSGPLTKRINQGDEFLFPIGQGINIGNKLMLEATQTGTLDWTVEYTRPNGDVTFNAPLTLVNPDEYWTVSSTVGSEAIVNISWDPASGLTPAVTLNGPADMRVSVYDGADWNAILSTSFGDNDNGSVETDDRQTFATGSDLFTTACVNTTVPLARFAPAGAVCGNAGIPVEFVASGAIPFDYALDYTINGVPQATINLTAIDLPYTLPTPTAGIYALTDFTYNSGGGTGIVSTVTVDVYAEPTVSIAGGDQQLCGVTQTTLAANTPVVGTGQWYFVSGTGGSLSDASSESSTINGTGGFTYELEWVISNGSCESRDTVEIDFPVDPDLSTFTSPVICSGDSYDLTNVNVVDANNTSAVYTYHSASPALPGNELASPVVAPSTDSTFYILATTGSGCTDELAVTVSVITTPAVDDIVDQAACDAYTLPTITGSNLTGNEAFYTGPGASGTRYVATDVINSTTLLYIHDSTSTIPTCVSEESFTVTVNTTPTVDDINDTVVCDVYTLLAITGSNLTGNQAYYTGPNGSGTRYVATDVINSSTLLYIHDSTTSSPSCVSEESFNITVNITPSVDDINDTVGCDNFVLPTITGTNLTGNEGYYTGPNGTGTRYVATDVINSSTLLYIHDSTTSSPSCVSEESFNITVNTTPVVNDINDTVGCDNFVLPTITGTNLTGNEGYYTGPNGSGTRYVATDVINSSTLMYIHDSTTSSPSCVSEESFNITVNTTPVVNDINDTVGCDNFVLPTITGTNLTGNEGYYTGPNGTGTRYVATDVINSSTLLYIHDSTTSSPSCVSEESFNITVNTTPVVNDINDTVGCDNFVLPAITGNNLTGNEGYYTGPNGTGTRYVATDVINSSTLLYIHDSTTSSPSCVSEESFNITVNTTPVVNDINDTVGCDNFVLPAITGTNLTGNEGYYTGPNGTGTRYVATDVINSSTLLYIHDSTTSSPSCVSEESFNITVNTTPVVNDINDTVGCDNFVLPTITGTNLTGNEGYYTGPNGTGTRYVATDVINSSTLLYIHDSTTSSPSCVSEESFNITVNTTPVVNDINDTVGCDNFVLPAITGTNLTGNQAYYTGPNGSGTRYVATDVINSSTLLYIHDSTTSTPSCVSEESFTITINATPAVNDLPDTTVCDSYTLLPITGTNLTGNEAYYTGPNGSGTRYVPAEVINTTTTLYIYDSTTSSPSCVSQESFVVTVNTTPSIDPFANQDVCDSFTLPLITGTNLTGNEAYYTGPNGSGTRYVASDVITTNTTLYVYDSTTTTPSCSSEQSFTLTVTVSPTVDDIPDQTACVQYTLPTISGTNLSGNEAYYTGSGAAGIQYNAGDVVSSTIVLYIYDENGSCSSEEQFTITIAGSGPVVDDIPDQTACIQYSLPIITGTDLTGNEAYYDGMGGTGTQYDAGDIISSTITLFIYDNNGSCSSEEQFTITIDGSGPVVDDIPDQIACVQYTLPAITGSNLTGNEAFFDGMGGSGTQYNAGDVISSTRVLYIYDDNGVCSSEKQFTITIAGSGPVVDDIPDQTACTQFTLPLITGTDLTGNEAYYTGMGGAGTQYTAGDVISTTTLLYIYDDNGTCSSEEQFTITIAGSGPVVDDIPDQTACVQYTLPTITGSNLTGNEAYFDGMGGSGTQYNAGDVISSTTVLYIYDDNGTCSSEEQFAITIVGSGPVVDDIPDQTACVQYTLPTITGSKPYWKRSLFRWYGWKRHAIQCRRCDIDYHCTLYL
jgi:hypothetical protein